MIYIATTVLWIATGAVLRHPFWTLYSSLRRYILLDKRPCWTMHWGMSGNHTEAHRTRWVLFWPIPIVAILFILAIGLVKTIWFGIVVVIGRIPS
jgi:hypothetical protein